MIKFIKSMLAGEDGAISSKRTVMFIFTLLFTGLVISNHITGKNFDETLKDQLFYLLVWCITMVFGEQIPDMIKAYKNRNAKPDEKPTEPQK